MHFLERHFAKTTDVCARHFIIRIFNVNCVLLLASLMFDNFNMILDYRIMYFRQTLLAKTWDLSGNLSSLIHLIKLNYPNPKKKQFYDFFP